MKLTAEIFWQQYIRSGKRHLLVTGWRGKGKSTLFNRLKGFVGCGNRALPGLTSVYIPKTGVMLVDNITKAEAAVGIYCPEKAEIGKNMIPYSDGFYAVGIPALKAVLNSDSKWFSVDEIGFLESREEQFQRALLTAMESRNLIAVVRKTEKGTVPFIDEILSCGDAFVIDLDDYDNADYWD
ncbi:MAG: hypothetical protein IKA10_04015 [Oscillospiraceae bacterium]|nr:hypothetical protein [Oscillospiraceae bacterium]